MGIDLPQFAAAEPRITAAPSTDKQIRERRSDLGEEGDLGASMSDFEVGFRGSRGTELMEVLPLSHGVVERHRWPAVVERTPVDGGELWGACCVEWRGVEKMSL